jgi:hypothetical protein
MKIALVKNGDKLTPAYLKDKENFCKLKNDIYVFEIKRDRHLTHHRKFWAILSCVCANSEKWQIPEQLLVALKIKLGYFNIVPGFDGTEITHAGSIAFEKMDQDSFGRFYDTALPVLAEEIGVTVEELESNSLEHM